MQELLRNQVISARSGTGDSHQQAAEAVSRLRALHKEQTAGIQGPTTIGHTASPPTGINSGNRPNSLPKTTRRLPKLHKPWLIGLIASALVGLTVWTPSLLAPLPAAEPIEEDLGAGYVQIDRSKDLDYQVKDGDTLVEIAYIHGLDYNTLAAYNQLANPDLLKGGQILRIPSIQNENALKSRTGFQPVALKNPRRTSTVASTPLLIKAEKQYDGASLTAHFSIETPANPQFSSYEWDLGNGKRAFRESPYWSYEQPGTYTVKLRARVKGGSELVSNPLFIDVPHPGSFQGTNQHFKTLGNLNETFRLSGEIESISGYQSVADAPISLVGQDDLVGVYQAVKPGFYAINLVDNGERSTVYLFASPIPSVHSERADMNWYRTQFNTGTLSNCGPSSVSMAYAWAKGGYLPVSSVRQAVGWKGNGSTSYEELTRVLTANEVKHTGIRVRKANDLFQIIDNGNIGIILINTGGIRRSVGGLNDLFGRYYSDVVGHYLILKGYSSDHKYLIVHDPIPSDWSSNSFRFADGISMSGRNRYYAVEDIMRSLRTDSVVEILRD